MRRAPRAHYRSKASTADKLRQATEFLLEVRGEDKLAGVRRFPRCLGGKDGQALSVRMNIEVDDGTVGDQAWLPGVKIRAVHHIGRDHHVTPCREPAGL